MPLFDATLSILEQSLDVRLERQNLLASNLANADTPGYKGKDLDFASAMSAAAADLIQSQPATAHANSALRAGDFREGHFQAGELASLDQRSPDAFAPPMSLSMPAPALPAGHALVQQTGMLGLDGNRVDPDHAMVELASNALNYGASAKAAAKKLAILSYVASDGQS